MVPIFYIRPFSKKTENFEIYIFTQKSQNLESLKILNH